jgi:hypothetical protein
MGQVGGNWVTIKESVMTNAIFQNNLSVLFMADDSAVIELYVLMGNAFVGVYGEE